MTTPPKHTRPFNIKHARAGAPFCCANGEEVEILKWDRKHDFCIVGLANNELAMRAWRPDGSYSDINSKDFKLVMTPLGFIDGKPYFWDTEMEHVDGAKVAGHVVAYHSADGNHDQYRWPAQAPVYPETRMTLHDLQTIMGFSASYDMKAIANAALRHAIDAGQVVAMEEHTREMTSASMQGQDAAHGKAEKLLKSMGYRLKDGEWISRAGDNIGYVAIVGHATVHGTKKDVEYVMKLVDDRAARDMAIAKRASEVTFNRIYSNGSHRVAFCDLQLDLAAVIAGVKS